MHIKDMISLAQPAAPLRSHEPPSDRPMPPVAMDVVLEEPVSRAQHLVDGVRRIKATPWYRLLRKRGLRFVPLGHREGVIVLVVGTAASLGATYLTYKRLKKAHDAATEPD
ncbi:MAG TPA: hypothetical protein VK066_08100 [Chloroflexota bacterium]|nr:hypothetical protein [Chloroflexota bacterium]